MNDRVVFEFPVLRALRRVDCSTGKCRANAYGTGRILRDSLGGTPCYLLEFYCPDCRSPMAVNSREVDALVARLLAAKPEDRVAIVRRWVVPLVGEVQPWRPRE